MMFFFWELIIPLSIAKVTETLNQYADPRSVLSTILGAFYHLMHSSALWGLTFTNLMETWFGDLFIETATSRKMGLGNGSSVLFDMKHYCRINSEVLKIALNGLLTFMLIC